MVSSNAKENRADTIHDVYELLKLIYAATGFWTADALPRKIHRIAYRSFKIFMYLSYVFHITVLYLGAAKLYRNLQMFSFAMTYLIIANAGVMKLGLLEFKIHKLKGLEDRLYNDLNLPWMGRNGWEKAVKDRSRRALTVATLVMYIILAFSLVATIFPPALPSSQLTFVIPTPFDHLEHTSLYLPIYLYQSYSLMSFIIAFSAHDLMLIGYIVRLCDHLEIIKLNLKQIEVSMPKNCDSIGKESGFGSAKLLYDCGTLVEVVTEGKQRDWRTKEKHLKLIKNSIAHHQAVFREVKVLGDVFSYTTFAYVACGPILIGLLSYVILSGEATLEIAVQQGCYVIAAGLFVLIQCYFGSQLSLGFERVRFALYDCPWYEMELEAARLISIALTTMEKTGKLRAGNFVDVALTTCLWLIKMSYNIVTFMKNTS